MGTLLQIPQILSCFAILSTKNTVFQAKKISFFSGEGLTPLRPLTGGRIIPSPHTYSSPQPAFCIRPGCPRIPAILTPTGRCQHRKSASCLACRAMTQIPPRKQLVSPASTVAVGGKLRDVWTYINPQQRSRDEALVLSCYSLRL